MRNIIRKYQRANVRWIVIILVGMYGCFNLQAQSLDVYIRIAMDNNPGLKSKQAMYEASLERITQSKGLQDPTFSVSAFGQMVETRVGQQMANFSIEQMFPWFGTLKARGDVEAMNAQAQFEEYRAAQNELVYNVKAAYYPLFEIDTLIKLNEQNLSLVQSYKELATSRFQQGKSPMVGVLKVNVLIEQIQTDIKILKMKRSSQSFAFNKLLNREAHDKVVVEESLAIPDLQARSYEDSIMNNPMVTRFDHMVHSMEARETLARKEGMPMLGIGFNYIPIAKRTDMDVPENGKDAYMPMASVSLPIYRKKYRAMEKEASLMRASYEAMRADEVNQLASEYEMTLFDLHEAVQQYHLYHHHIVLVNQSIELLTSSLENSRDDLEDILRMQSDKIMHESEMIKALVKTKIAEAKLNYIAGR